MQSRAGSIENDVKECEVDLTVEKYGRENILSFNELSDHSKSKLQKFHYVDEVESF